MLNHHPFAKAVTSGFEGDVPLRGSLIRYLCGCLNSIYQKIGAIPLNQQPAKDFAGGNAK